jgi:hypothetical protein
MSTVEFYRLTPRQFAVLLKHLGEKFDRDFMPFACLRSDIANICGAKSKPQDFMPGKGGPAKLSGDAVIAMLRASGLVKDG